MNGNYIIFTTTDTIHSHVCHVFHCGQAISLPGALQCIMYYLKAKKNGEMRKVYKITEFIALML